MQRKTVRRRLRAALLVPLFLVFIALALPATGYAAPQLVAFINLRNTPNVPPTFIPVGNAVTGLSALALSPHASNDGTFFMLAVKVDLTGFTRACFSLDFEGTPVGWTLNVGDDPSNDGFGGGTLSSSVAEVQILEEVLAMYSAALGLSTTITASHQTRVGTSAMSSIGGFQSWTTLPSDARYKTNVKENVPGLAFINKLRPVTYQIDVDGIQRPLDEESSGPPNANTGKRP